MAINHAVFEWMQNEENPHVLILIRGLPSAGKSYRALELAGMDDSLICSADKFFGETAEEYVANWSGAKLGAAHRQCREQVRRAMQRRNKLVIVDNTNTVLREMLTYFSMAIEYGYRVRIEEPTSPWWVTDIAPYLEDKSAHRKHLEGMCKLLAKKSEASHKVPVEAIQKMLNRYVPNVTFNDLKKADGR